MTWVAVGIGAVTAIGGIMGSNKAAKTQKQAIALQRDQLNFNKQRYEDYQNQYGGIIDLVVKGAEEGVDPNLGQVTSEASADTATAFKNAQTALDNQNQRLGINPNSGRADSSNRQLSLSQAIATAGNVTNARNTERKSAADQTWNRRFGVYQQGNSLINGAANTVSNSASSLASTTSSNANSQSQLANQAIAGGLSSITQGLLSNMNTNKTTTVPIDNIESSTKGLKVNGTSVGSGVLFDETRGIAPYANQNSFLTT
ncbi:hypothetical protein [Acinetobacter ursingii]|uniref:hypothetical protein n=1 Tax=Acinetobacter ursingii TaxID=108980 RepID=UPI00124CD535|nr:hypothetical protein [Acinetobacter ursingii]